MGELLGGAKGMMVNFVVRNVKKMVPAFSLPNTVRFKDALAQGARMTFTPATLKAGDVAFLQYTGGTTGVVEGRHADAPQRDRQRAAKRSVVGSRRWARRRAASS